MEYRHIGAPAAQLPGTALRLFSCRSPGASHPTNVCGTLRRPSNWRLQPLILSPHYSSRRPRHRVLPYRRPRSGAARDGIVPVLMPWLRRKPSDRRLELSCVGRPTGDRNHSPCPPHYSSRRPEHGISPYRRPRSGAARNGIVPVLMPWLQRKPSDRRTELSCVGRPTGDCNLSPYPPHYSSRRPEHRVLPYRHPRSAAARNGVVPMLMP
jgi:hypothetical protein